MLIVSLILLNGWLKYCSFRCEVMECFNSKVNYFVEESPGKYLDNTACGKAQWDILWTSDGRSRNAWQKNNTTCFKLAVSEIFNRTVVTNQASR